MKKIIQKGNVNFLIEGNLNVEGDFVISTEKQIPKYITPITFFNKKNFIGRTKEIVSLKTSIDNYSIPILLNGIGGIGKTTLVLNVLDIIKESFDHILFLEINGDLKSTIIESYAVNENLSINEKTPIESFFNSLRNIKGRNIIIIDNIIEEDIFLKNIGSFSNWKLVGISREDKQNFKSIYLDKLTVDEATALFFNYYKNKTEQETVLDILEIIDYHPLFIEILSNTLNFQKHLSIIDLRDNLKEIKLYNNSTNETYFKSILNYCFSEFYELNINEKTVLSLISIPNISTSYDFLLNVCNKQNQAHSSQKNNETIIERKTVKNIIEYIGDSTKRTYIETTLDQFHELSDFLEFNSGLNPEDRVNSFLDKHTKIGKQNAITLFLEKSIEWQRLSELISSFNNETTDFQITDSKPISIHAEKIDFFIETHPIRYQYKEFFILPDDLNKIIFKLKKIGLIKEENNFFNSHKLINNLITLDILPTLYRLLSKYIEYTPISHYKRIKDFKIYLNYIDFFNLSFLGNEFKYIEEYIKLGYVINLSISKYIKQRFQYDFDIQKYNAFVFLDSLSESERNLREDYGVEEIMLRKVGYNSIGKPLSEFSFSIDEATSKWEEQEKHENIEKWLSLFINNELININDAESIFKQNPEPRRKALNVLLDKYFENLRVNGMVTSDEIKTLKESFDYYKTILHLYKNIVKYNLKIGVIQTDEAEQLLAINNNTQLSNGIAKLKSRIQNKLTKNKRNIKLRNGIWFLLSIGMLIVSLYFYRLETTNYTAIIASNTKTIDSVKRVVRIRKHEDSLHYLSLLETNKNYAKKFKQKKDNEYDKLDKELKKNKGLMGEYETLYTSLKKYTGCSNYSSLFVMISIINLIVVIIIKRKQ